MTTEQQEKILLHWIEKICRRCDEQGIRYGIFIELNITIWSSDIDEFLKCYANRIRFDESCLSSSDINIMGFHEGPEDTPWNRIYGEDDMFWEIPFTALLDPEFHAAFDAEFEYRKFNYLFRSET